MGWGNADSIPQVRTVKHETLRALPAPVTNGHTFGSLENSYCLPLGVRAWATRLPERRQSGSGPQAPSRTTPFLPFHLLVAAATLTGHCSDTKLCPHFQHNPRAPQIHPDNPMQSPRPPSSLLA